MSDVKYFVHIGLVFCPKVKKNIEGKKNKGEGKKKKKTSQNRRVIPKHHRRYGPTLSSRDFVPCSPGY